MITGRPVRALPVALVALALALTACSKESDSDRSAHGGDTSSAVPEPARAGAAWLTGQLRDGVLVNRQYRTEDYSTTVEVAYALRAVDSHSEALPEIASALAAGVDAYASPGEDVYAGSLAKLASFAADQGDDPRDFGGHDLIAELEERTADDGPLAGRISDKSEFGDYANAFGQAWAVRALSLGESAEAEQARDFLLAQQCREGFFRLYLAAPDAPDQSCDGAGVEAEPVDTTALAYVLLHDLAPDDAELAAALDRGIAYILSQQAPDGSFSGGSEDTVVPNTNSTGLAGWALHLAGEGAAAADAARWVRAHQLGSCEGALAEDAGAIAFDEAALDAGTSGLTKKSEYQWRLATAQALPSLLAVPEDATEAPCPDAS